MLGDVISEETGQVTGVRVLESGPSETKVEATAQMSGTFLGEEDAQVWTYWSVTRPDGTMYGEANGLITTKSGASVTAKAQGIGQSTGPGMSASWRGAAYYYTSSDTLSRANTVAGAFEYEVDEPGQSRPRPGSGSSSNRWAGSTMVRPRPSSRRLALQSRKLV